MSRCFPYPPPGYVRNPVAVAEAESTAKLQKGKGKAEKKKEKRSDKKALQQGDASKHSKHSHKKRKHEDISAAGQEPKMVSKESVEQLEKSGLSEEHGAPCFIQTVRDSPESSQDSSKRRKVVLPSPSQSKNGNILRIKIKRDQDSQAAVLEKPMVLGQPTMQHKSTQHHNKASVKSAATAQHRINGDLQAVQKQVSTQPHAKIMQRVDPRATAKVLQQIDPQLSMKAPVGATGLPERVMGRADPPPPKATQRVQPPPVKVSQGVDAKFPSDEGQRKCPPAVAKVAQKETVPIVLQSEVRPQILPVQKPEVQVPIVKQHQQPITSLSKEEPCFSGRQAEAGQVQEVKQSRLDRKKSHKAEKKERKFRDLFVTWNPPSFEMQDSDLGEQDWLIGSKRNSDASMISCRASDGSVPFQPMEQQSLLQPRATLLPDLHIYQLPYVVPF